VKNEKWQGIEDIDLAMSATGIPRAPDFFNVIPRAEASVNAESGGNYTRKISGFLTPPTTITVDFLCASDDPSAVLVSTDANPANKRLVCRQDAWDNPWQWTVTAGGVNIPQRSSATWTNAQGVAQFASGITLSAGQRYYFEVVQSEGGGGDHVEMAMVQHGFTPVNGTDYSPGTNMIGIAAPKANWVRFTLQPTNTTQGPGALSAANFYAFGDTDSQLAVGDIRANANNVEVADQFVFFQWFKNNVAIPGATQSRYTQTGLRYPADNGAQFMCQMRSLGYGQAPNTRFWSNSVTATLTVTNDPTVPHLIAVGYMQNPVTFQNFISLTFDIALEPSSLTNLANYTIPGVNVTEVYVAPDNKHVHLVLDGGVTLPFNVTVSGMQSWSGIAIGPPTTRPAMGMPANLTWIDIGNPNPGNSGPTIPSKLWIEGPNAYTIAAEGRDIWDAVDGFTFLYETKTGDFDVVLRQTAYGTSSPWAKCGLQVRELIDDFTTAGDLAGQSRNWTVVNDPPNVPVVGGTGANIVESGCRLTNNVATENFGRDPARITPVPTHPNAWVRLRRQSQILTCYAGSDGKAWEKLAQTDVTTNSSGPLPDTMYVGIAVTGHNTSGIYNFSSVDSYNSLYVQPAVTAATLTAVPGAAPGTVQVSWTPAGGVLYSSSTPDFAVRSRIGGANPATVTVGTGPTYFRVEATAFP
jgi:hypothetical protein